MQAIIQFIGLCCLVYLAVESHPIQALKARIGFTPDAYLDTVSFLAKMFDCCMCLGFWVGLIYYQDILIAGLVSLFSELIYRKFSS